MTKTPCSVIIFWLCIQLLQPQLIGAESTKYQTKQALSADSFVQKMTVSPEPDGPPSEIIENVEVDRQIVQFGGNFHLKPMETVESLVVIGGNSTIRGHVSGNVLVLKGNVEVRKGAQVLGKVTTVLGEIRGKKYLEESLHREINGWRLVPASAWLIMRPQEAWGMGRSPKFGWSVLAFIALTLIHIVVFAIFPKQINTMAQVIFHRPIGSTLLGMIVLIIIPCLTAVLVLSIIGIPLVLLFFSILLPMAIYGKTAIFLSMGNTMFSNQPKIVAVVAGYWIYFMATSIPHVDLPTFLVANTIGVGVCVRTIFAQKSGQTLPPFTRPQSLLDRHR